MIKSIRHMSIFQASKYIETIPEHEKNSTILISIREPSVDFNTDTFPYDNLLLDNYLILQFDDVSDSEINNIEQGMFKYTYKLFNEKMANEISEFVGNFNGSPDKYDLIIHCHAGVSRSVAIYMVLSDALGLPYNKNYIMHNKLVYNTLYKKINGKELYGYDK